MKFRYFPHPLNPKVTFPLVTANIQGPKKALELQCFVDSGAENDSFPISVAQRIGIPIESCPSESIFGIGGEVRCYLFEVEIVIEDYSFRTEAQFLEPSRLQINGQSVLRDIPPLLGRKNTFSNFKIIFDEANQELELIPYHQ